MCHLSFIQWGRPFMSKKFEVTIAKLSKTKRRKVFRQMTSIIHNPASSIKQLPIQKKFRGIIRARALSKNEYIVFTIDVHHSKFKQIIRIWDFVVNHSARDKLLIKLCVLMGNWTDSYLTYCKEKVMKDGRQIPKGYIISPSRTDLYTARFLFELAFGGY